MISECCDSCESGTISSCVRSRAYRIRCGGSSRTLKPGVWSRRVRFTGDGDGDGIWAYVSPEAVILTPSGFRGVGVANVATADGGRVEREKMSLLTVEEAIETFSLSSKSSSLVSGKGDRALRFVVVEARMGEEGCW